MKNAGDFPRLFLMKEGIKMINLKDCAPLRAVNRIKRKYPDVFEIIDSLVKEEDFSDMWDHGKVFIPVSGARAAMEHVGDIDFAKDGKDLALVPALAAWRQHKTIYEFAPALTEELFETARRKKLTLDISAIHLPHWAIYVKTGIKMPADIDGFFISYDEDIIEDTGKHYTELRFTPIDKNGIPRHVIYLIVPNNNGEPGSIESCLRRNMKFSEVDERRIEEMMKTGYTEMKEMLKIAYKEGIRCIIATPHHHPRRGKEPPEVLRKKAAALLKAAHDIDEHFRIYLGTEIFFGQDVADRLKKGEILTMNRRNYVLVEFSPSEPYGYIRQSLQQLQMAGYEVILAHVERYSCITDEPELAEQLSDMGIWLQVNAGSITGQSGRRIKKFIRRLMDEDLVFCVGTDAHSAGKRAPRMKKAAEYVKKKYGEAYAAKIFYQNAKQMLRKETNEHEPGTTDDAGSR